MKVASAPAISSSVILCPGSLAMSALTAATKRMSRGLCSMRKSKEDR